MSDTFLQCFFKDTSSFTVGEIKELTCQGAIPLSLSASPKIEFLDPAHQHSLKILGTSFASGNKIVFRVTGYQPGDYQNVHFQIIGKTTSLYVKNLSWTIPSILTNKETASMHPPYGPWLVPYPTWYVWSFAIFILCLVGVGISWIRKYYQKKELKQRVVDRLQEKTPLQYFTQQVGLLMAHHSHWSPFEESFNRVKNIFREFLEHQLSMATELSTKKAISQIKNQPLKEELKQKAIQILLEFDKININPSVYSKKDGEKLLEMIREWVFRITETKKESQK